MNLIYWNIVVRLFYNMGSQMPFNGINECQTGGPSSSVYFQMGVRANNGGLPFRVLQMEVRGLICVNLGVLGMKKVWELL